MPISLSGSLLLTGSLTTNGTITAQTLVVQVITSSIVNFTGSNTFGSTTSNVQQMTGSLRVTGSGDHYIVGGNVGIGTTGSTSYQLEISSTSDPTLGFYRATNSLNFGLGRISWDGLNASSARTTYGRIQTEISSNVAGSHNGSLIFYTAGAGTLSERMRISGSGNVGIGTTTPGFDLDIRKIKSTDAVGLRVRNDGTANESASAYINIAVIDGTAGDPYVTFDYGGSSVWALGADNSDSDKFKLSHNGTTYKLGTGDIVSVTTTGNVGIGTANPLSKFVVLGTDVNNYYTTDPTSTPQALVAGSQPEFLIGDTGNATNRNTTLRLGTINGTYYTYGAYIRATQGDGIDKYFLTFGTSNAAAATEKMRITSAGNVGVGTTVPETKFHLNGGGTSTAITNVATTVTNRIDVANPAITLGIGYISDDIPLIQSVNNVTSGAIGLSVNKFGGNVGIGTNASIGRLSVGSATGTVGFNAGTSASPERGNLWYDTDGTGWKFNIGKYSASAFHAQMTIEDNTGEVGIGTTSPAYKLDVNGTFRSNALWTDASAVAYWGSGVTPTVYGVLTWDTNLARVYANTGNRLELGANATVYLTVGTTGNVTLNSTVYNNTAAATVRTLYIGGDYIIGGVSSTRESKTNIETITDINWLYALDPVSFNYRKKNASGSYTEEYYEDKSYGLIAEDVAPVNDLLCNYDTNEDGTKKLVGIEYPRLIVPLLKALQQQQAKITELESRIQQLENK